MISMISGKIADFGPKWVIVEISGIGYKVRVTEDTLHELAKSTEVKFWTHMAVREDAMDLYGFLSKKDRDFFELLITVSSIGPKTALNISSTVSSDTLISAIRSGSTAHLTKVSGIGRKTAEKIILELKDKINGMDSSEDSAFMSSDMDAIDALRALGYDSDDAREALKKISKEISDTGEKVKAALKILN